MKIGVIGCGNMARAILTGMLREKLAEPGDFLVSARSEETLLGARDKFGIAGTRDNGEVAEFAEILFLAVKPAVLEGVLEEIRDRLGPRVLLISLAAGRSLDWMGERLPESARILRTMPNTPAMVGEGMTAICRNAFVEEADLILAERIFSCLGRVEFVPEKLMDVVTGVSGSAPAYVFLFLEAMADAAVHAGMPREQAYHFAGQAVLGSARLLLETGRHPGELKDMVCSPAGTTIEAVRILEEKGMRSAVFEAVRGCIDRAKNL